MAKKKEKPLTREDVLRLIKENGGKAKGLDLSKKCFEDSVDLSKLNLEGIILTKAVLSKACLRDTSLVFAKLQGAFLWEADLQGADLIGANLQDTDLRSSNLQGIRFLHTKISQSTVFVGINWGDFILAEERQFPFDAVESYQRLKAWYNNTGMYDIAAKFYYREKEAGRKGARHWNDHVAGWFSWTVFGHGERWKRILLWIAGVISIFALIYFVIGTFFPNFGTLTPNTSLNSLYYSVVSFTALGYGRWAPEPAGLVKGIGAFESLVGVSMMALLLVTFFRKWTR